jgi:small subunit ribosomal protein S20
MERHASAVKAARQSEVRRARNQSARAHFRTLVKTFKEGLAAPKKDKEKLTGLFNEVQKVLMKAGNKGLIKKETSSRQISRLSIAFHKALA